MGAGKSLLLLVLALAWVLPERSPAPVPAEYGRIGGRRPLHGLGLLTLRVPECIRGGMGDGEDDFIPEAGWGDDDEEEEFRKFCLAAKATEDPTAPGKLCFACIAAEMAGGQGADACSDCILTHGTEEPCSEPDCGGVDEPMVRELLDQWSNITLDVNSKNADSEPDSSSSQPEDDVPTSGVLSRVPQHGMARPLLAATLQSAHPPTVASPFIINFLFIALTCDVQPGIVWLNQALKSANATEEWHYRKPTTTINFGHPPTAGTLMML